MKNLKMLIILIEFLLKGASFKDAYYIAVESERLPTQQEIDEL